MLCLCVSMAFIVRIRLVRSFHLVSLHFAYDFCRLPPPHLVFTKRTNFRSKLQIFSRSAVSDLPKANKKFFFFQFPLQFSSSTPSPSPTPFVYYWWLRGKTKKMKSFWLLCQLIEEFRISRSREHDATKRFSLSVENRQRKKTFLITQKRKINKGKTGKTIW